MWTLFRGAQAHELRLRGVQFLPFKSETWAAVCQRTQQCYQVSARLHTLISRPPPPAGQLLGLWGITPLSHQEEEEHLAPLIPLAAFSTRGHRTGHLLSQVPSSEYSSGV